MASDITFDMCGLWTSFSVACGWKTLAFLKFHPKIISKYLTRPIFLVKGHSLPSKSTNPSFHKRYIAMSEPRSYRFSVDIAPAVVRLVADTDSYNSLTVHERTLLQITLSSSQTECISSILETLSHLLLRPCLTLSVLRLFRTLLVELAGRCLRSLRSGNVLLEACPAHGDSCHQQRMRRQGVMREELQIQPHSHEIEGLQSHSPDRWEATLNAFAQILPTAPQLLR